MSRSSSRSSRRSTAPSISARAWSSTAKGHLFVTLGERSEERFRGQAQELDSHLGKIVRIHPERRRCRRTTRSSDQDGALPEIWSYGHRNIQAAAINPGDRRALGDRARPARRRRAEHPRGRQELRLADRLLRRELQRHAGRQRANPTRPASRIRSISGRRSSRPPAWPSTTATPSPNGRATSSSAAWRRRRSCAWSSTAARSPTRSACSRTPGLRIRDVVEGPGGALYLLTDEDNGEILRITPAADATD